MKKKKIYIRPELDIVRATGYQLLAASPNEINDKDWGDAKGNPFSDWDDNQETWGDSWSNERNQWQQVGSSYELPHTKSLWDD